MSDQAKPSPRPITPLSGFSKVTAGSPYINMLLYGKFGSGKTHFGCEYPGNVCLVDIDKGAVTALNTDNADNVYPIEINQVSDVKDAYLKIKEKLDENPGSISVVVFDNLTAAQTLVQSNQFAASGETGILRTQDWGTLLLTIQNWITLFKGLKCHKVWIAQESLRDGFYSPSLSGQIKERFPGEFDLVARLICQEDENDTQKRYLVCKPTDTSEGKDRVGCYNKFEAATLRSIIFKFVRHKIEAAKRLEERKAKAPAATPASATPAAKVPAAATPVADTNVAAATKANPS